ncbi:lecithin retinol acyltransferase family protein [Marinomonas aquiplantarum]|uniref:Lecithin:retinol acyltransferase n=1 Tax=Marinomonas aquiplantarum TaxID=491951 RepID=A0A366CXU3_9GAMM|nr:lecithin retinol acyltransferase family protein [Marinomonas aquiplantarum]RBO82661.1 lecithin:retinol acyltransferase [Marinomonas aquiplantarum]
MDSKIKPGDKLYRSKSIVEHSGVYLGNNQVVHNSPSNHTEVVGLEEFADGKAVKVISNQHTDVGELNARVQTLLSKETKYQLFSNNCEQVSSFLLTGKKYSPQIAATGVGFVGGFAGAYISGGKPNIKSALMFGALGALIGCLVSNATREYDDVITQ